MVISFLPYILNLLRKLFPHMGILWGYYGDTMNIALDKGICKMSELKMYLNASRSHVCQHQLLKVQAKSQDKCLFSHSENHFSRGNLEATMMQSITVFFICEFTTMVTIKTLISPTPTLGVCCYNKSLSMGYSLIGWSVVLDSHPTHNIEGRPSSLMAHKLPGN